MNAIRHRPVTLSFPVRTKAPILLIVIVVFLPLLSPCSAIPTCSPTDENVVSGTVDVIDVVSSHTYTFVGDASTISWHLKIPNPENGKFFEYYPIMILSI